MNLARESVVGNVDARAALLVEQVRDVAEMAEYKRLTAASEEADQACRFADAELDNARAWRDKCEEARSKAIESRDAYARDHWAKRGGEPGR